jgi:hypothetical protein
VTEPAEGAAAAGVSPAPAEQFAILWETLSDILGTGATAALVAAQLPVGELRDSITFRVLRAVQWIRGDISAQTAAWASSPSGPDGGGGDGLMAPSTTSKRVRPRLRRLT